MKHKRAERKKKKRIQRNKSVKLRIKSQKAEERKQIRENEKVRKRLDIIGPPDTVDVFDSDV